MRAAAEGRTALTETFARHMDLCLGCRACETACPSGVAFGSLIEATRAQLRGVRAPRARHGWVERFIFAPLSSSRPAGPPHRRAARVPALRPPRPGDPERRAGVSPAVAGTEALLPEIPEAVPLPEFTPARGSRRGRVGLLSGCVQRHLFPAVNAATVDLLALAGYEVVVPARAGLLRGPGPPRGADRGLSRAGERTRRGVSRRLESRLHRHQRRRLRLHAARVRPLAPETRPTPRDWPGALATSARCWPRSELPLGRLDVTVTYHDACHLAHGQRVRSQPRALLARIPGLRLVELAGQRPLLRERGRLQSPGAGDGRPPARHEARSDRGDRGPDRRCREPRLRAHDRPGRAAAGPAIWRCDIPWSCSPVPWPPRGRHPEPGRGRRGADMKIRVRDHIAFQADKMAKVALAATPPRAARPLLPGPGPGPETPHARRPGQDLSRAGGARPHPPRWPRGRRGAGRSRGGEGGRGARRGQRRPGSPRPPGGRSRPPPPHA